MKFAAITLACGVLYGTTTATATARDGPNIYPAACDDGMEWSMVANGCVKNTCSDPKACEGERCVRIAGKCNDETCHHVCMGVETEGCPENYEMGPDNICYPVNCFAANGCKPDDECISVSQLCLEGVLVCPQFACRHSSMPPDELPGPTPMPPIYPPCKNELCNVRCAHGLKYDPFGCQICECEPCPRGEKLDADGSCVPYSCESKRACPEKDLFCAPIVEDCEEENCPEFQCVPAEEVPKECDEYFGWDPKSNMCVPTDCESEEACPDHLECVHSAQSCSNGLCKNFICVVGEEPPPDEPKDCPPVCEIYCPFGNVRDEKGCKLCQCQTGKCPLGEEFNDFTKECVPVTCESEQACPGVPCRMADPPRMCFTKPCSQIVCEAPPNEVVECEELECDVHCEYGHVLVNGCPTCDCNRCPKGEEWDGEGCTAVSCDAKDPCPNSNRPVCVSVDLQCVQSPCPQFMCVPHCREHYEFNEHTQSCEPVTCEAEDACHDDEECIPSKRACFTTPCQQFICEPKEGAPDVEIAEEDGKSFDNFKNETDGNSTTNCDEVMCELFCENGFVKDDKGCDTCACKTCAIGEEYDEKTDECVPVSCDSERACATVGNNTSSTNETCIPQAVNCVTAPCPQFICAGCQQLSCVCDSGTVEFGKDDKGCSTCECASSSFVSLSAVIMATAIVAAGFVV